MAELTVTLSRSARNGLGLGLQKTKKRGTTEPHAITVNEIMAGTPAQACRKIEVNDNLVAVNGNSTQDMTFPEILKELKRPSVMLTFRKPSKHNLKAKQQKSPSKKSLSFTSNEFQSLDSDSDFGPWEFGDHAITPDQQLSAGRVGVGLLPQAQSHMSNFRNTSNERDAELCTELRPRVLAYFMQHNPSKVFL